MPISRAIEASSALPGLFPPVAIDGQHYVDGALNKTLHASLALDAGVDLLLCVNPLVPFDAQSAHRRGHLTHRKLDRGGLPLVLSQTFRAIIHSRMKAGMDKYATQYPHADILLFEPAREDVDMFFAQHLQLRAPAAAVRAGVRVDAELPARAMANASRRVSRGMASRCVTTAFATRHATSADALNDPRPLHARRRAPARRPRDRARSRAHARAPGAQLAAALRMRHGLAP